MGLEFTNDQMSELNISRDSAASLARPFYFMVPFWGARYRAYFVDRLLPALLAPNNLPLLRAEDGHRFLIATTPEDWAAIADLPIMKRLRKHAPPTLVEISSPTNETAPGSTNAVLHQNLAQKLLIEVAFKAKVYGCLLCPDHMVSDGMMLSLIGHAREGRRLVICPVLRQSEEATISELEDGGYLPRGSTPSQTGAAINIPPRILADLLVRHLHPEMARFEAGAAEQSLLAPFRYWRLPDHRGIILHTFYGSPVLMDYGAVTNHDVACLEQNSTGGGLCSPQFQYRGRFLRRAGFRRILHHKPHAGGSGTDDID